MVSNYSCRGPTRAGSYDESGGQIHCDPGRSHIVCSRISDISQEFPSESASSISTEYEQAVHNATSPLPLHAYNNRIDQDNTPSRIVTEWVDGRQERGFTSNNMPIVKSDKPDIVEGNTNPIKDSVDNREEILVRMQGLETKIRVNYELLNDDELDEIAEEIVRDSLIDIFTTHQHLAHHKYEDSISEFKSLIDEDDKVNEKNSLSEQQSDKTDAEHHIADIAKSIVMDSWDNTSIDGVGSYTSTDLDKDKLKEVYEDSQESLITQQRPIK